MKIRHVKKEFHGIFSTQMLQGYRYKKGTNHGHNGYNWPFENDLINFR